MPIRNVLTGNKQHVPVKVWTDNIDLVTQVQLRTMAELPFVYKHISAMPDTHLGKGSTVGSVIATIDAIIPAAIGVDIGCGMCAVKTDIRHEEFDGKLNLLYDEICKAVPVGHLSHNHANLAGLDKNFFDYKPAAEVEKEDWDAAKRQIGTLGGGNHFIEVCLDTEENVWLMLHSGSRRVGKLLAEEHIKTAQAVCRQYHVGLPDPFLAYLVAETPQFAGYMADLHWAQDYAMNNRRVMMALVKQAVADVIKRKFATSDFVNCHHNYVEMEHHFNKNVWVTRKGAIRARKGDMGIIPGSMGTRSYIVRGLGCEQAFCSAPHGAGRQWSRGKAKEMMTQEMFDEQTKGVVCRKDSGVWDEAPAAYKDIDQVMDDSDDLVEVVAQLRQIVCVKG
jgi:tRNA-splicing ligase RtcB